MSMKFFNFIPKLTQISLKLLISNSNKTGNNGSNNNIKLSKLLFTKDTKENKLKTFAKKVP